MFSDYIVIGADLVPTKSNTDLFIKGDAENLVGEELKRVLTKATYRIFNLEVPLTDQEKPILKQGPNLIAPTATIRGYEALSVDLVTLANNHILDQGEKGLFSTIQTLDKTNINYVGAGKNLSEGQKPFIFTFAGRRIGVYACAEHEFSIANDNKPGANPFDPLWSLDHLEELKRSTDYIIVLYHGGKEHYRYPSPNLQKTCRRMMDKGADLVICQHSHCIGCEEKYQGGTIVYGQGNFIFDDADNEFWNTSLLVTVDENFDISYIPLTKHGNAVRVSEKVAGEKILEEFRIRSAEIKKEGFIEKKYAEFAEDFYEYYLSALMGERSFLFRVINIISGDRYKRICLKNTYNEKSRIRIENYFDCEAHRELLLQSLKSKR